MIKGSTPGLVPLPCHVIILWYGPVPGPGIVPPPAAGIMSILGPYVNEADARADADFIIADGWPHTSVHSMESLSNGHAENVLAEAEPRWLTDDDGNVLTFPSTNAANDHRRSLPNPDRYMATWRPT